MSLFFIFVPRRRADLGFLTTTMTDITGHLTAHHPKRACVSTLMTPEPWQRPGRGTSPWLSPRTMTGMTAGLPDGTWLLFRTKIASSNLRLTRYWRSSPIWGAFGLRLAPPPQRNPGCYVQSFTKPAPSKPPNHLPTSHHCARAAPYWQPVFARRSKFHKLLELPCICPLKTRPLLDICDIFRYSIGFRSHLEMHSLNAQTGHKIQYCS